MPLNGRWYESVGALLGIALVCGCGDDTATADMDAGLDPDAEVAEPLHCTGDSLLIMDVVPMDSVTIFNPTGEDLVLSGTGWALCQRPSYVQLEMIESDVTIPAGGSHTYDLPPAFFDQGNDGGEVALYRSSAFTDPTAMRDYVCWGSGRAGEGRRDVAEAAGLWSGGCTDPITGSGLRRVAGGDGTSAASYDPTGAAPALTCPAR